MFGQEKSKDSIDVSTCKCKSLFSHAGSKMCVVQNLSVAPAVKHTWLEDVLKCFKQVHKTSICMEVNVFGEHFSFWAFLSSETNDPKQMA